MMKTEKRVATPFFSIVYGFNPINTGAKSYKSYSMIDNRISCRHTLVRKPPKAFVGRDVARSPHRQQEIQPICTHEVRVYSRKFLVKCAFMQKISTNSEKLRAALIAEKSDEHVRMARYKALTAKIAQHQVGHMPAPTEEEFTQWLADVKHAVNLKKMMTGG